MKNSGLFSREGPAVDRQPCPRVDLQGFSIVVSTIIMGFEANFRSQKRMVEIRAFLNPYVFPPASGNISSKVGSVLEETRSKGPLCKRSLEYEDCDKK
jgi:hypothetical protein